MSSKRLVTFAANNGDMGGGEVMLLKMAHAARSAGWTVEVVGPEADAGVLDQATSDGFAVHRLAARRHEFMKELRSWDATRLGLLWCNGLVPALATAAHAERVVHVHRSPSRTQRAALAVASSNARARVVPSAYLAHRVGAEIVLPNWNAPVVISGERPSGEPLTLGFLGRWAHEKGLDVLLGAAQALHDAGTNLALVIAGESRFDTASSHRNIRDAIHAANVTARCLGWVAPRDLFQVVDALVVPSRLPESFGLVAAEAMSAGVPVITTDAGALPEVVGPSHPWIARAGNVQSLSSVILDFAQTPSAQRHRVIEQQRLRWLARFSPQVGERSFERLLATFGGGR